MNALDPLRQGRGAIRGRSRSASAISLHELKLNTSNVGALKELILSRGNKSVNDDLCAVEEVTKLAPARQTVMMELIQYFYLRLPYW